MNDSGIIGLIKSLKKIEWGTRVGLLAYCLVTITVELIILGLITAVDIKVSPMIVFEIIFGTLLLLIIIWSITWLRLYKPKEILAGICIATDEDGLSYYKKLISAVKQTIADEELSEIIEFKVLPSDRQFKENHKAEKFIIDNEFKVLIWGDTDSGTISGVECTKFNIRISCQYKSVNNTRNSQLDNLLRETNKRAFWDVQKTNSLPTLKIVAGNVFEMSLFTLALCLETVGELRYALASNRIMEKLYTKLEGRIQDSNFPNLNFTRDELKKHLVNSYMRINEYYNFKSNYNRANGYVKKALVLKPNDWRIHQDVAMHEYKMGNIQNAWTHTLKAENLAPKKQIPKINKAFLHFVDGDYKKGLNILKHLKPKLLRETPVLKVIEFNLTEYDKNNNEIFLFLAGYFNIKYADDVAGKKQISEFLKIAKNNSSLDSLAVEAESITQS